MRLIEIRGERHDIDDLVERGRALHGEAVRALLSAFWRSLRRPLGRLTPRRKTGVPARRSCQMPMTIDDRTTLDAI